MTPCAVSVTRVGDTTLTPSPDYSNNINVGTATASYSYAGDTNHTTSGDSETFAIVGASLSLFGLLDPYAPPDPAVINGINFTASKQFKLGSSIPLKWQYQSGGVVVNSASANPSVSVSPPYDCNDAPGETTETVNTPGSSALHYDAASQTWQINWKTTGLAGNKCYAVAVQTPGGATLLFPIKLKK